MPDVLYIHPAKHDVDSGFEDLGYYFFIPVGVIALLNLLRREGLTVRGVNYPAELMRNRDFRLRPWLAAQSDVKLVLVDLHWYMHSYGAIRVARACKQVLPGAQVALGGITASLFAAEILRAFPEVDLVIRGDAEQPLLALAKRLCAGTATHLSSIPNLTYRSGGQVLENQRTYCATPDDLDGLNFVDLGFLEHAPWYGRLQFEPTGLTQSLPDPRGHWLCIGRGCRYDCSFCGGGRQSHEIFAGRNGFVLRSPEKVAQDIQRLAQMGTDQVSLNLDPAILLLSIGASYLPRCEAWRADWHQQRTLSTSLAGVCRRLLRNRRDRSFGIGAEFALRFGTGAAAQWQALLQREPV